MKVNSQTPQQSTNFVVWSFVLPALLGLALFVLLPGKAD